MDNLRDYIGKYFLIYYDDGDIDFHIYNIDDIINGEVFERWLTVTDNFIDVYGDIDKHKFDKNVYDKGVLVDEGVWDHVTNIVNSATEKIEHLIDSSIISKQPLRKGDCVVDKKIKSLNLADEDHISIGCPELSYSKDSFYCEYGPMSDERWNKCENVKSEVFRQAENVWFETKNTLIEYLRSIYNKEQKVIRL